MRRRRGVVFVTALLVSLVLGMLASALWSLTRGDVRRGAQLRDRARALAMARGGLNRLLHRWTYDSNLTDTLEEQADDLRYRICFAASEPADRRSCNNLNSALASGTRGADGALVPAGSADVVVCAQADWTKIRLRALVERGVGFRRAVGAVHSVTFSDHVLLDNVNGTDTGGGVRAEEPAGAAISFGAAPTLLSSVRLETRSGAAQVSGLVSPGDLARVDTLLDGPQTNVPEFDVSRMVSEHAALPAPTGMTAIAGGSHLLSTALTDARYVNGNLTVDGDLNMHGGSLFVNGNLTLNGGIVGEGSVFASGDAQVLGGASSLVTNQAGGAALYSDGEVLMHGDDVSGVIHELSGGDLAAAFANYQSAWATFTTNSQLPPAGVGIDNGRLESARLAAAALGAGGGFWPAIRDPDGDNPRPASVANQMWVNPFPNLNGSHSLGDRNAPIPRLDLAIRQQAQAAGRLDTPRVQALLRALDQEAYLGRGGVVWAQVSASAINPVTCALTTSTPVHVTPWQALSGWDDSVAVPDGEQCNSAYEWVNPRFEREAHLIPAFGWDHQLRVLLGQGLSVTQAGDPLRYKLVRGMLQQVHDLAVNHPSDLSWLSEGNFTGLVYARGAVRVAGSFHLTGALLSRSAVTLTDDSHLTFDPRYLRQRSLCGPLKVSRLEEI